MMDKQEAIRNKMKELASDEEQQEVLNNPASLWVAHRLIKRLCRVCKAKVVSNTMDKNLRFNKSWLCDSCKRIHDLEMDAARMMTE